MKRVARKDKHFAHYFIDKKIGKDSHNNRRGLRQFYVRVELRQKMIVRGHGGRVVDLCDLDRCLQ